MTRPTIFEPGHERRQTPRLRRFKQASLSYGDGFMASSALLRDLSSEGARLETENAQYLPQNLNLVIGTEDISTNCKIVWRTAKFMGVEFNS